MSHTAAMARDAASVPLVSVIVAVHDVAGLVGACLASLRVQRHTDFEAIVVDDGSTDGSAAVVRAAIGADARFRVIRQANAGLGAARNAGLDAARGRYVAFLDGDDRLAPGYLAELLAALRATGAPWAACGVRFVPLAPEAAPQGRSAAPQGREEGAAPEEREDVAPKVAAPEAGEDIAPKVVAPKVPKVTAPKVTAPKGVTPKGVALKGVAPQGADHPAIHGAGALVPGPVRLIRLDDWCAVIRHFPSAWNKLYRRDLIGSARFPEATWYEDHAFFWRLAARADRLAYVPRPLYWQTRGRAGQITARDSERVFEQFAVLEAFPAIAGGDAGGSGSVPARPRLGPGSAPDGGAGQESGTGPGSAPDRGPGQTPDRRPGQAPERGAGDAAKAGAREAFARIATRLMHERAAAVADPGRRARFARACRGFLERHGLDWRPDWDGDIARSWGVRVAGRWPLSVVIPVDAGAPAGALAATLASVAAQGLADLEVILAHDGPPSEATRATVARFARRLALRQTMTRRSGASGGDASSGDASGGAGASAGGGVAASDGAAGTGAHGLDGAAGSRDFSGAARARDLSGAAWARTFPGAAWARDAGLAAARGDYVVFLDAGDRVAAPAFAGWVEAMLRRQAVLGVSAFRIEGAGAAAEHGGVHDPAAIAETDGMVTLDGAAALALHAHPSAKIFARRFLLAHGLRFATEPFSAWGMSLHAALAAGTAVRFTAPGVTIDDRAGARRLWRAPVAVAAIEAALDRIARGPAADRLPPGWRRRLFARAVWEKAHFADYPDEAARDAFREAAAAAAPAYGGTGDLDPYLDAWTRGIVAGG